MYESIIIQKQHNTYLGKRKVSVRQITTNNDQTKKYKIFIETHAIAQYLPQWTIPSVALIMISHLVYKFITLIILGQ